MRSNRIIRFIGYSFLCAVIACFLCFIFCFVLAKYNVGFFSGEETTSSDLALTSKTALKIYTIQHVELAASGVINDGTGNQEITANMVLPYSVWSVIPFIAIFIALLIMPKTNREIETRHGFLSATLVAFFYALIHLVAAMFVQANMDSVPIPEINGLSVTPPMIGFKPVLLSAFIYTFLTGIICAALRYVYRYKHIRKSIHINYWLPCASSVVSINLVIAILLSAALWFVTNKQSDKTSSDYIEIIPVVVSNAYSALFGSSLSAKAVNKMSVGGESTTFFDLKLNIYKDIVQKQGNKTDKTKMKLPVKLTSGFLVLVIGFFAGFVAVRKKSPDASLGTSTRVLVCQLLIIIALMVTSNLMLLTNSKAGEFSSVLTVEALSGFAWQMPLMLLVFLIGSIAGAQISRKTIKSGLNI